MRPSIVPCVLLVSWIGSSLSASPGEPVLVELFTSEGCSSCPPADRLLAELEARATVAGAVVVPLSLHVDYWNRLGWADPYSKPEFSRRQSAYAATFGGGGRVYTPQMVVDGESELAGSDDRKALAAIDAAAKRAKGRAALRLLSADARSARLRVEVSLLPAAPPGASAAVWVVWVALAESGLEQNVSRGENAGRRLSHTAVVRSLEQAGSVPAGGSLTRDVTVALDPAWRRESLSVVAFAQVEGGRVVAVTRLRL